MSSVNKSEKDRVIIFDTTLRDGEQCPGATMTFEEKLEVAEMLDDMGVDVIEAGFPITSEGGFPPFLLDPIDFAGVYAARKAEEGQIGHA